MKTILNQLTATLKKEENKNLTRVIAVVGVAGLLMFLHSKNKLYASEGERILRILEKGLGM